jgi:hypothetical protein
MILKEHQPVFLWVGGADCQNDQYRCGHVPKIDGFGCGSDWSQHPRD